MKNRVLAVLIFIAFFSCDQENLRDLLAKKINLFNTHGDKYFYSFDISSVRENENSVFRVDRFDTSSAYAIIELKPHSQIHKNFFKDSIGIEFVDAFDKLECTSLIYFDNHVRIIFKFKGKKYLLFRGYPQKDSRVYRFDTTNSIQIDGV